MSILEEDKWCCKWLENETLRMLLFGNNSLDKNVKMVYIIEKGISNNQIKKVFYDTRSVEQWLKLLV